MREVKFQAWDKWEKEMLPVAGINFTNEFMWINELIDDETSANTRYLDEVVLRQYTGVNDVKNREIFEGDIGWVDYHDCHGLVKNIKGKLVYEWGNSIDDFFKMFEHVEVIGNIYENPELLESENE